MKRAAFLLICTAALLLAGCGGGAHTRSPGAGSTSDAVRELTSIGQLRAAFDAHQGLPRLIVLLSPT